MPVFVSLSAKAFGTIGTFTGRANGGFAREVLGHCIGLPLYHSERKWLIHIISVLVRTGFVHGYTYVCSRPRRIRMSVSYPTHIASFEVLLALVADG